MSCGYAGPAHRGGTYRSDSHRARPATASSTPQTASSGFGIGTEIPVTSHRVRGLNKDKYILGEIFRIDHRLASGFLEISYRSTRGLLARPCRSTVGFWKSAMVNSPWSPWSPAPGQQRPMVTFSRFPTEHGRRFRTTSVVELPLAAVRLGADAPRRPRKVAGAEALGSGRERWARRSRLASAGNPGYGRWVAHQSARIRASWSKARSGRASGAKNAAARSSWFGASCPPVIRAT